MSTTTTCPRERPMQRWASLRLASSRRFTFEAKPPAVTSLRATATSRARLAVVWCVLLIILSSCASGQPLPARTPAPSPRSPVSSQTESPSFSSQPSKPAKPQRTSVTVVLNGDLLWHNTLWFGASEDARRRGKGGYDFAPLLAGLKPVVASADLAICHEEVPLAPQG